MMPWTVIFNLLRVSQQSKELPHYSSISQFWQLKEIWTSAPRIPSHMLAGEF